MEWGGCTDPADWFRERSVGDVLTLLIGSESGGGNVLTLLIGSEWSSVGGGGVGSGGNVPGGWRARGACSSA